MHIVITLIHRPIDQYYKRKYIINYKTNHDSGYSVKREHVNHMIFYEMELGCTFACRYLNKYAYKKGPCVVVDTFFTFCLNRNTRILLVLFCGASVTLNEYLLL